ncbi:MAG TPA: phosphotransferase [Thermomicrobiales bacterium]|nr:phosphotransferase [Thermomicrobiales bacterium]
MKPFDQLTIRGKARRLRPLALSALEQYDLDVERLELVRNDLNGIFRVRTADGRSYLLRVCLPNHHTLETLQAEVAWLQALEAEPDIAAPAPIPAANGEHIVTASAPGVPEPRRCMVFSWLPGRPFQRPGVPEEFELLGRLMARLHDHTDRWQPPEGFTARRLDRLYSIGDPAGLLGAVNRERFDGETQHAIAELEARITAELDRLFEGRPQVIHADLHHGNVKLYRGTVQPLDFEDLGWGFPVQDIAISLFYSLNNPRFPELREAFQRGYTAIRSWPEERAGQINLLIAQRGLDLLHYMLSSAFPGAEQWFPAFVNDIHGRYREMAGLAAR